MDYDKTLKPTDDTAEHVIYDNIRSQINCVSLKNDNYNLLNLGYVSYSPSIYFKKLDYFISEKKIKFKKIFLFVDTSDIQDEGIFYREDKKGNIVRKWNSDEKNEQKNFKYLIKNYLKQNSFIFKFYEIFFSATISEGPAKCLENKNNVTNFVKYLDYERFGYAYDAKIQSNDWVIEKPIIFRGNQQIQLEENIKLSSHFNFDKINKTFRDLNSLNLIELFNLKRENDLLGYSSQDIDLHFLKIISLPIYLSIMVIISAIIMLNIKRDKPYIFHVLLGILLSVIIYYINNIFNIFGLTNKIPIYLSVFFPIIFLSIVSTIGLIRINEK